MSDLYLDRVWLIECTRCANQGDSIADDRDEATFEFQARGWTQEHGNQFCPACNGATSRVTNPTGASA